MKQKPALLAVILAAGRSNRFQTSLSKMLTPLCGKPIIHYPVKAVSTLEIPSVVVLGHQAESVERALQEHGHTDINTVLQQKPQGTGDAVRCSMAHWGPYETILVLNGDMPLVSPQIISELIDKHNQSNATVTFAATNVLNPRGYGRVVQINGQTSIVEEKDCSEKQKSISLVNAGIYLFNKKFLEQHISNLSSNNASNEFYLTDLVLKASQAHKHVEVVLTPFDNVQGVNTLEELWRLEKIKRNELIRSWMARGVRFENPENTRVDVDVTIGKNSIIGSGVLILRGTHVGEGSMIGAFSILGNAIIGSESTIRSHTVIQDSIIGEKCILGPFVRVRGNSVIHNEAHVESFADITRSTLLPHAHVPQLSAVVDTKIDKDSYQANIFVKQEKPNLSTPQQHS